MTDLAKALATPVYHMNVETLTGVKPHGFHLGTDLKTAETFVYEQLRTGAMTVALYYGQDALPLRIYDYRDLPEYEEPDDVWGDAERQAPNGGWYA